MIRLLDLIPAAAGVLLLLVNPAQAFGDQPLFTVAVSGGRSLAIALVLLYLGRLFAAQQETAGGRNRFRSLKNLLFAYLGIGFVYILYLIIGETSVQSPDRSYVIRELVCFMTTGTPWTLWFFPAALLSAGLLFLLPEKNRRSVLPAAAAVCLLTVVVCSYQMLSFPALAAARDILARIFAYRHCGVFTAFFFVAAGAYCKPERLKWSAFTCFCCFLMSAALMGVEIVFLAQFEQNVGVNLFLFTIPTAVFLFLFLLKLQGETAVRSSLRGTFGISLLLSGQFCYALEQLSVLYPDTLPSRLFATGYSTAGIAVATAFLAAVIRQTAIDDTRGWLEGFSYYSQSLIFALFRPVSKPLSLLRRSNVGRKIENGLSVLAFFVMTALIWFYERGIGYSTCGRIYTVCCVVILLCAVHDDFRPGRVSTPAFLALFLTGLALLVSACLYWPENYVQFGLMILFFFIPLTVFTASAENGAQSLFSCYTAGSYISFVVFFEYCVLFRPYDITRYKGPFCNSNMCGLYLIMVFAVALCNLPAVITLRELKKKWAHFLVAGFSFGFILLTISRTALAAALGLLCVKLLLSFPAIRGERGLRAACKHTVPLLGKAVVGLSLCFLATYLCVRWLPGLLDRQNYLYVEMTDSMLTPYKVLPGASLTDPNYISLPRFFEAWFSRTVSDYGSLNEMSTGRLDIYRTYLNHLTFAGHAEERIPVVGNDSNMIAHNAFLQIAYNCGLPMGLLYLGNLLCGVWRGAFRKERFPAAQAGAILAVGYAVSGMFESIEVFYYPVLFAALLGLSLSTLSARSFALRPLAEGAAVPDAGAPAPGTAPWETEPALPEEPVGGTSAPEVKKDPTEEKADQRKRLSLLAGKILIAALLIAALLWFFNAAITIYSEPTRTITQQLLEQ